MRGDEPWFAPPCCNFLFPGSAKLLVGQQGYPPLMTLRIGHIDYLNCAPFFHYLDSAAGGHTIVRGTPARLNALLAEGRIDLCPASSFEYGRHASRYLLLPGLSISAIGPVHSVLLFGEKTVQEGFSEPIAITGESASSVALLQILLEEAGAGPGNRFYAPQDSVEQAIKAGGSGLLIGDRALKAAKEGIAPQVTDLGALWHAFSGLPFVFALWIVRREVVASRRDEVNQMTRQLRAGLARSLADLPQLAARTTDCSYLSLQEKVAYWRAVSYGLSDVHLAGLRLFFQLAVKYRLLPQAPEPHFV